MTKRKTKLNITRMAALVLALFVLVPLLPVTAAENSCGDNLTWSYSAGTLTITGSGEMDDYRDGGFAPWYEFRENIIKVNLPEGLTSVGNFAFIGCSNLKMISIPDKVLNIGSYAFASCKKLTSVKIGAAVRVIGESAFYNCYAINVISLPYGVEEIGSSAFYRCESLTAIKIHHNVKKMGTSVFAYCKSLVRAEIDAPLKKLPAWTFYGCKILSEVSLKETIEDIENNAFKECDILAGVFYPSDEGSRAEEIEDKITADVPTFGVSGNLSSGTIPDSTTAGSFEEIDSNTGTQTNITVWRDSDIFMEYSVTRDVVNGAFSDKYTVTFQLTLEKQSAWDKAIEQLTKSINSLKDQIGKDQFTLKVYLKNDAKTSKKLTDLITGVNVKVEVMSATGSVWRVNGMDLVEKEDIVEAAPPPHDFSHTVQDASQEIKDKVGTDDCFELTFTESMEEKAEILVQLPPTTADKDSNAFLYQVEENGDTTRLQAVKVDNDGVAHFYLANTDKDTQYVVGVNVPGEKTDDVIIPDELLDRDTMNAITRLEQIEFVATGRREVNGLGLGEIMIFTFVGLALTMIVVGVVMFFWNKKRLERENAARRMQAKQEN